MSRKEVAIFTNMCMVYDDVGNVLVQNRVDPEWPGIAFPGGHIEKGESFTDAVIREVFEETGLSVYDLQMCGIKDWIQEDGVRYIVFLYKTNRYTGTLNASEEGDILWVPLDKLPELELAEGMESMLKVFFQDTLSEQYFVLENGTWVEILK